jgi:hypothetical protein
VEGVVSGLLRSKGEGLEPKTHQFPNQIDAVGSSVIVQAIKLQYLSMINCDNYQFTCKIAV